jgi:hypothetical protein
MVAAADTAGAEHYFVWRPGKPSLTPPERGWQRKWWLRRAGQYSCTDKRRIRRILQSSVAPVASGAVAALVLLPRATPAGIVATDLLVLGDDALLGRGSVRARFGGNRGAGRLSGGGDGVGAGH